MPHGRAHAHNAGEHDQAMSNMPYIHLGLMAALHFAAMYMLMYAMVDAWDHVHPNNNQLYMAGLMTSPMLLIELVLMGSMYPKKAFNVAIMAASAAALVTLFLLIRAQTAIGDSQFLKSMIPHHSGAILMCQEATITDQRIADLCRQIIAGQSEEIALMETLLESLD